MQTKEGIIRSKIEAARLGNICYMIAEAYCKGNAYAFGRQESMYDCSLYDEQNAETFQEPKIIGNKSVFRASVSSDCGLTWSAVNISLPTWMVDYALKGKLNYVTFRQITVEIIEERVNYQ